MGAALVFPGQGSQSVGMDAGLDGETFAEADDALGFALSDIVRDGPEERLAETAITQPAILATSVAWLRALRRARPDLTIVGAAGHSLGEISALVAADSLGLADALRLVRLRGEAMQAAVPLGVGTMAAVMGLDDAQVEALCAEAGQGELVAVAATNCPGQVSVAGHVGAVDRLIARAEAAGGAAKRLAVSAPFHCALLAPAGERLREALATIDLRPPSFPVVHNADAGIAADVAAIRAALVAQVTLPVRWSACFARLRVLGATEAIEVGPGKTLAGLGKRIDRALPVRHARDRMTA